MSEKVYLVISHSQGWNMSINSRHSDKENAVVAFRALVEKEYESMGMSYAEIQAINEEEGLDLATLVDDSSYVNYEDDIYGFGIVSLELDHNPTIE